MNPTVVLLYTKPTLGWNDVTKALCSLKISK